MIAGIVLLAFMLFWHLLWTYLPVDIGMPKKRLNEFQRQQEEYEALVIDAYREAYELICDLRERSCNDNASPEQTPMQY